jgi:mannose-6-phosphate isomerase-like protein (cupin superfamily)
MSVRRVVTGHTREGAAVVASDEVVMSVPVGAHGSGLTFLWGRDEPATFPDDGVAPETSGGFPLPGGCGLSLLELAPEDDDFHEWVRSELAPWADPDEPGMHRSATMDFEYVLEGMITLELDDGVEVTLGPGDVVVQNGTRHRWHNRGTTVARMLAVSTGAHHEIQDGRPI